MAIALKNTSCCHFERYGDLSPAIVGGNSLREQRRRNIAILVRSKLLPGRNAMMAGASNGKIMGREIVRVPLGFRHPTNANGEPVPSAHLAVLYGTDARDRTAFQIYENVTEGSPESPVFNSLAELVSWLIAQGVSRQSAEAFVERGSAPSFAVQLPKRK
jgi:hypothetical protein